MPEKNKTYRARIEGYTSESLGVARIDGQAVAAAVQLFERIAHGVGVRPLGVEHVGCRDRVNGRSGLIEQEDRAVFLHFCGQIARLQHERKEIAGLRLID